MTEPNQNLPKEAAHAWAAACEYLARLGDGKLLWYQDSVSTNSEPYLLFRFRNQLFAVFINSDVFRFEGVQRENFLTLAEVAGAIPCVMSMMSEGSHFVPSTDGGWGLRHAISGIDINPLTMQTAELFEVSDFELQHMSLLCASEAVRLIEGRILEVRRHPLENPTVTFTLNNHLNWIIVRGLRLLELKAVRDKVELLMALAKWEPADLHLIFEETSKSIGGSGAVLPAGFVPMAFLEGTTDNPRIYRGHDMAAMFLFHLSTGPQYAEVRLPD